MIYSENDMYHRHVPFGLNLSYGTVSATQFYTKCIKIKNVQTQLLN